MKLKKIIALTAILAVMNGKELVLFAGEEDGTALSGVSLERLGEKSDPERQICFGGRYYMYKKEGDQEKMLDYLGKENAENDFQDIEYFQEGIYEVSKAADLFTLSGMVKADGTVLIPCEAAVITRLSDRYLKVVYGERETENQEEALFYTHEGIFSLQPSEEDVLYAGYMKVYDLEKEKFIESITITSPTVRLETCADKLCITDENGNMKIYNSEGEVICEDASQFRVSGDFFVRRENSINIVYSSDLERLFETEFSVSGMTGRACLSYYNRDTGLYGLLNQSGDIIVEAKYSSIDPVGSEAYKVRMADDKEYYGIIEEDGTIVAECEFENIEAGINQYYIGYKENEEGEYLYTLIGPDGIIYADSKERFEPSTLLSQREINGSEVYFVVEDQDYTLTLDAAEKLGVELVSAKNITTGLYGVFELWTGEQILDYAYTDIQAAYGYLYAYKDGVYTVYQVNERE